MNVHYIIYSPILFMNYDLHRLREFTHGKENFDYRHCFRLTQSKIDNWDPRLSDLEWKIRDSKP